MKLHAKPRTTLPPIALLLLATAMLPASRASSRGSSEEAPASAPLPEGSMAGQVVLVTGSTDGLGREVALRLASAGAHVLVHGRNAQTVSI